MKKRRIDIILDVAGKKYKFFSIFFQNDSSFYLYQHIKNNKSPISVSDTVHLLKADAKVNGNLISKTEHKDGHYAHISFHPDQIHIKKRMPNSEEEYLSEIFTPQKFHENHFRLLCILTPAPVSHLPTLDSAKDEIVEFKWPSDYCPQISLYEIEQGFNIEEFERDYSETTDVTIIPKVGSQPWILLQLKSTNGDRGVWLPQAGVFGKRKQNTPISKVKLQQDLDAQGLAFDISSIPDIAEITEFHFKE